MPKKEKHSILIVDDLRLHLTTLTDILSKEYTIYTANNGTDAIATARELLPTVVLLDVVMPKMDGYAVLTVLKRFEKTRHIPVILVTDLGSADDEEKGLALGAADFIAKPFRPAVVKLRVKNQIMMQGLLQAVEYDITTYRLAIESLNVAMWGMDVVVDDPVNLDNFFQWSPEFRSMLGLTSEEEFPNVLRSWAERLHPDDRDAAIAAYADHINDYSGNTPYYIEYRLLHKDGEYRYFDGYGQALRTFEGVPIRVSGAIKDVTESKKAELALKESEERLQLLLNALPLVCQLINKDFVTFDCNHEALNLFGLASKEEYCQRFGELLSPSEPEGEDLARTLRERISQAFSEGYLRFEWALPTTQGKPIPFDSTLIRVRHQGEDVIAAYTRDLREQKALIEEIRRAEIAEASSRAKSNFLATMSHEIRTPMNSIVGFADIALETPDGVSLQVRDYLNKISDSAKWLLNIINDILDISKIESGKMVLERVPFGIDDVFMRCQSVIMPSAKSKDLELVVHAEPLAGKKTVGDPVRLYQALMNLLSNAVKFTDRGTVMVSAAVRRVEEERAAIVFEVMDSGIGMSAEQISKVFDPFTQADSSTTRNYGGTGLGLAITKNIVELMGGNLEVKSSPGAGSLFHFEIVFDTVDSVGAISTRAEFGHIKRPTFDALVLVCDDTPMNREVMYEHLARVGIRTELAENGFEGVKMVKGRQERGEPPYDLIFMDIFMPVMDGVEAAETIAALGTGTPLVAMTANIMAGDLESYRHHGMPDYIGKPFTAQELWSVLLKHLTPVEAGVLEGLSDEEKHEAELLHKLQVKFVKSNQDAFKKIAAAVKAEDSVLAHRLVHSLKGSAGMTRLYGLQRAAAEVETILRAGSSQPDPALMDILKDELTASLEKLAPLLDEAASERPALDAAQTRALFARLEPLLDSLNPTCVDALEQLRAVPGAENLARLIENYDFEEAGEELAIIRGKLG